MKISSAVIRPLQQASTMGNSSSTIKSQSNQAINNAAIDQVGVVRGTGSCDLSSPIHGLVNN